MIRGFRSSAFSAKSSNLVRVRSVSVPANREWLVGSVQSRGLLNQSDSTLSTFHLQAEGVECTRLSTLFSGRISKVARTGVAGSVRFLAKIAPGIGQTGRLY